MSFSRNGLVCAEIRAIIPVFGGLLGTAYALSGGGSILAMLLFSGIGFLAAYEILRIFDFVFIKDKEENDE